jgi:hypothetical protein
MFRLVPALAILPLLAAEDDTPLRRAFEGKSIIVKLDMPGDDGGISVYPQREDPVDHRKVGDAIRKYGAALRKGDEVVINKVHVKPKLIEFQLGGGGFGSWGDNWNRPSTPSTTVRKSSRERDLEKARGSASGAQRERIDRELSSLERQRRYEESRRRGGEAAAKDRAQQWEAGKRLKSGSRFNLQYPDGVPPAAATPEGIMAALRNYVDFRPITQGAKR